MTAEGIRLSTGGHPVCWWAAGDPTYEAYHNEEWGRGVTSDRRLFEKLCLEGFQAGLSWITVLRKRPRFREVFHDFDPEKVSRMGDADVERLLGDAGIIRHRGKIESTINNAFRALDLIDEFGSIHAFVRPYVDPRDRPAPERVGDVHATTDASTALSKDLKRRGWSFVGPTTVYAFMQAMGLVNDHLGGCWAREPCEESRQVHYA